MIACETTVRGFYGDGCQLASNQIVPASSSLLFMVKTIFLPFSGVRLQKLTNTRIMPFAFFEAFQGVTLEIIYFQCTFAEDHDRGQRMH